jgi:secondary thiamine-phosphate synthase enzyme
MHLKQIEINTKTKTDLIDITSDIDKIIRESKIKDGICFLFTPHTTGGLTLNENADPSVRKDILMELNKNVPFQDGYHHTEGNASAHIKTTLVGSSQVLFIESGKLVLGTWQGIFFCEFDGPRRRTILVKISET